MGNLNYFIGCDGDGRNKEGVRIVSVIYYYNNNTWPWSIKVRHLETVIINNIPHS